MMDSQDPNVTLNTEPLEEHTPQAEPQEEAQAASEDTVNVDDKKTAPYEAKTSKAEIISRLKELAQDVEHADKAEIDFLKQNFYKLHKAETEAAKKAFVENGGDEAAFVPEKDPEEDGFKSIMKVIKEKRSALTAEQEQLKEENLKKKLNIIERLKALIENSEDANKSYNEFKALQQEWNDIKLVPVTKVNELWKSYQHYVEKFYDLLKLNGEFREYDFKKNLEIKTHLCEAAEKLADEPDVISAFHQLQKLHQQYREVGPVSKELRESIWSRFKAASAVVNRRHQQHFEEIKAQEQHNLDQKTVICEIVEATEYDKMKTIADWDNKNREILALQAKWKTIGFAPMKVNQKIFERFRAACDVFFKRKGEFFRELKENLSKNLEKKVALCELAEALKDSTEWKETSEKLTQLQKEWKTIGPVAKKHSDAVWKRFIAACDYFFDQKKKATSSQRSGEMENLGKKKDIIARLKALNTETLAEDTEKEVRNLVKEWNSIGHVPFKDKDKLRKEFRELADQLFDKLNISSAQRKLDNFKSSLRDNASDEASSSSKKRKELVRAYEAIRNEIQTYENNLGFLSSSSKKGKSAVPGLVAEVTRKVEKLKGDLALLAQKIAILDEESSKEK